MLMLIIMLVLKALLFVGYAISSVVAANRSCKCVRLPILPIQQFGTETKIGAGSHRSLLALSWPMELVEQDCGRDVDQECPAGSSLLSWSLPR